MILLLFSGPRQRQGSLREYLHNFSFTVEDYDLANGESYDLIDDAIWDPLYGRIKAGKFLAIVSPPPCGTFLRVRNVPGGPPPLRGTAGAERYGLGSLSKRDADTVRAHYLLAQRTALATQAMVDLKRTAVAEQPAHREGELSMYLLGEFLQLREHMTHTKAVQCSFGARAAKLTSSLTFGVSFADMSAKRGHPFRPWYEAGTGDVVASPHPPARGRRRFSTLGEALQTIAPYNTFNTSELSYYTPLLNKYLALKLKLACARRKSFRTTAITTDVECSTSGNWSDRVGREEVFSVVYLRVPHLSNAGPTNKWRLADFGTRRSRWVNSLSPQSSDVYWARPDFNYYQ